MSSFSMKKSWEFYNAARKGNLRLVEALSLDPEVEIDWRNLVIYHRTPFLYACLNGHVDVVNFLLGLDQIDYNLRDDLGNTPFLLACDEGREKVVERMLEDERIDVNLADRAERTPLWMAAGKGHLGVVKLILAAGRPITVLTRDRNLNKTAAEIAQVGRKPGELDRSFQERGEIGPLIEAFQKDPMKVRAMLRKERLGPLAGELFSLVVFLSDGYLEIQRDLADVDNETRAKAHKFFSLALQLPMDLQVVLCNRVFGIEDSVIKSTHSERGFRKFAKEGL